MANVINATSTGNGGLISTGDDSGVLNIQTNETTAVSIDASQNATFTNGVNLPNTFGFKNRIINGGMVIDQRNAGASITPVDSGYTLDRWKYYCSQASKFTCQQNAGSVTPPVGFKNYLGYTSSSAYSVGAGDYFCAVQGIEGLNVYDLNWGSASAQTVTLSFWVRCSLTGTFSGALTNSGNTRNYVFTYTISSANTWEYKTVTIAGDQSGTWLTTNGLGLELRLSLGVGSSYSQAAGSWGTTNAVGLNGTVNVVSTNGATFYFTGVQLEKGTQATSFDFRSIGTELALCQRYYFQDTNCGVTGYNGSSGSIYADYFYPVSMRASATPALSGFGNSNAGNAAVNSANDRRCRFQATISTTGLGYSTFSLTCSAEL